MTPTTRTRHPRQGKHEVVVVGARCAGAATALLLARQGHDVLVIDRASFPSDTLSSHAIGRGGVVQLARWGLLDAVVKSGAPEIRDVTFHFGDGAVLRRPVEDRAGVGFLLAPRRHVLDTILLSAAVDAGARFVSGLTVSAIRTDESGRAAAVIARDRDGQTRSFATSFVVGADGVRSRVARAVGARLLDKRPSNGSAHYVYVAGLDADGFEFHVGPRAFAGVFPTHAGEANVWVCVPADNAIAASAGRDAAFMTLLEHASPSLAERVRAARITSPARSAARLPNHVREAAGDGWALVGDAGYHRDPITGHGITDAFRDAELLARQLSRSLGGELPEREALSLYADQRAESLAGIFDITCALAEFPPADDFVALQKELNSSTEAEAAWLAALGPVRVPELVGVGTARGSHAAG